MKEAFISAASFAGKYAAFFTVLTVWIVIVIFIIWSLFPGDDKPVIKIDKPSSSTTYDSRGIDDIIKQANDAINRNDSIISYWRSTIFKGENGTGK